MKEATYVHIPTISDNAKKVFSLYLLTYYYTDGVLGAIKLHCFLMSYSQAR